MNEILKSAVAKAAELTDGELALINQQALRPLVKVEVFSFKLAACDNQVDRDYEQFTDAALEGLATLFVGKSILMDHMWSAGWSGPFAASAGLTSPRPAAGISPDGSTMAGYV